MCCSVFYEDWWNAKSFASYSKKWNLVIYNWNYNYFFLPMLEAGYSKQTADLLTFWLWAAMQEYVFTATAGVCYPVLLVTCMVFGVAYYSVPFMDSSLKYYHNEQDEDEEHDPQHKPGMDEVEDAGTAGGMWNVFLWIMLFLQNGFFVSAYAREWYAWRAHSEGKIVLDDDSLLPYSWQTAMYPNGTRVCH